MIFARSHGDDVPAGDGRRVMTAAERAELRDEVTRWLFLTLTPGSQAWPLPASVWACTPVRCESGCGASSAATSRRAVCREWSSFQPGFPGAASAQAGLRRSGWIQRCKSVSARKARRNEPPPHQFTNAAESPLVPHTKEAEAFFRINVFRKFKGLTEKQCKCVKCVEQVPAGPSSSVPNSNPVDRQFAPRSQRLCAIALSPGRKAGARPGAGLRIRAALHPQSNL